MPPPERPAPAGATVLPSQRPIAPPSVTPPACSGPAKSTQGPVAVVTSASEVTAPSVSPAAAPGHPTGAGPAAELGARSEEVRVDRQQQLGTDGRLDEREDAALSERPRPSAAEPAPGLRDATGRGGGAEVAAHPELVSPALTQDGHRLHAVGLEKRRPGRSVETENPIARRDEPRSRAVVEAHELLEPGRPGGLDGRPPVALEPPQRAGLPRVETRGPLVIQPGRAVVGKQGRVVDSAADRRPGDAVPLRHVQGGDRGASAGPGLPDVGRGEVADRDQHGRPAPWDHREAADQSVETATHLAPALSVPLRQIVGRCARPAEVNFPPA